MKAIDFHGFQVDSAGLSGWNPSEFFTRSPGEMRSAESPPENPPHQQSQARQKFHSVESRKRAVKHPEARHRRRSGVARHEIDASPERDNLRLDDESESEHEKQHYRDQHEPRRVARRLPPEQRGQKRADEDLHPAVEPEEGAVDFRRQVSEHAARLFRRERLDSLFELSVGFPEHAIDGPEAARRGEPHGQRPPQPHPEDRNPHRLRSRHGYRSSRTQSRSV